MRPERLSSLDGGLGLGLCPPPKLRPQSFNLGVLGRYKTFVKCLALFLALLKEPEKIVAFLLPFLRLSKLQLKSAFDFLAHRQARRVGSRL